MWLLCVVLFIFLTQNEFIMISYRTEINEILNDSWSNIESSDSDLVNSDNDCDDNCDIVLSERSDIPNASMSDILNSSQFSDDSCQYSSTHIHHNSSKFWIDWVPNSRCDLDKQSHLVFDRENGIVTIIDNALSVFNCFSEFLVKTIFKLIKTDTDWSVVLSSTDGKHAKVI